jgi:crotonobetainyl-CoA:carnitine CoA-transferase CaiB-like acyl-CoA transferase
MGYLDGYRVVDLTDFRGMLAGRLLADLGAEVVAVEPRGGSAARTEPPFAGDDGDSLLWTALAFNKKSITCDIHAPEGRQLLLRLCAEADFLLLSGTRREVASLGLDYDELQALNPRLIAATMTPFGTSGPKADFADTDLVMWAASGTLGRNRVAGRVPTRIGSSYHGFFHGASDAVVGCLLALAERRLSGCGQQVDISFQESLMSANQCQGLYPLINDVAAPPGKEVSVFPVIWETRDGFVQFTLTSGPATGHFTNNFMSWVAEHGLLSEDLASVDWRELPQTSGSGLSASGTTKERYAEKGMGESERARIEAIIKGFFRRFGSAELLQTALERRLLMAPIQSAADIMSNSHHDTRNVWFTLPATAGAARQLPGRFARIRPEAFAEHGPTGPAGFANDDIYKSWLGLGDEDLSSLRKTGVI